MTEAVKELKIAKQSWLNGPRILMTDVRDLDEVLFIDTKACSTWSNATLQHVPDMTSSISF